jgi:superfamily II DNA/RNA helicase
MKPEQRSQTLLGITRSKAKMFEYDVPSQYHIDIPQDPSRLFTLSIGMLGDLAARSNEGSPDVQQLNALKANLQFSARFFDAYMQGRFDQALDPYLMLLGAASYYLCELPGSSLVLAQIIGSHPPDLGGAGLEDLLRWTLQDRSNAVEVAHGPYAQSIEAISTHLGQFFLDGSGLEDLLGHCSELKRIAYDFGSPRQLLLADIVCAVVRKKCSNSSWQALPKYTGLSDEQWLATIKKAGFVSELWPAQHLLGQSGVLRGISAVVQMPTSAGKTRATELIIRSAFLADRTSLAVVVAPFRALCHEIKNSFVRAFRNEPVNVDELSDVTQGDFEIAQLLRAKQILVVTPEKFVYVLRHTPELASHVGVLIFDEGHQFDSGARGITYELLLTSLKSMLPPTVQKILISAVISNAPALAEWLNGAGSEVVSGTKLIPTFRTVGFASWTTSLGRLDFVADHDPETEEFFVPRVIEQLPLARKPRELKDRFFPNRSDGRSVALLLGLKLVKNGAVAIFCGRKTTAANLCEMAVDIFDRRVPLNPPAVHADPTETRRLAYLHAQNLGSEAAATRSAELGIFAHHGNTPHGIRLAVEHAMRAGLARFVVCTSTLAQGVNLPIRYLLVTSIYQGPERIKVRDFHNLIGRAGRAGMHTEGSILFADADVYDKRRSSDGTWRWNQIKELLEPSNTEPCISSLLSFFDPLHSDDLKYTIKLDAMDFVRRYIDDPKSLAQLAQSVAMDHADKGFTRQGLERQMAWKTNVIAAIESFLMSHWDAGDVPMTADDAVTLAHGTLAYFLANAETKQRITSLFGALAQNVAQKVTEPTRRKVYGKTPYGVTASQAIEEWVRRHLAELLSTETTADTLRRLWPLVGTYNQNDTLRKCSNPQALENLALAWISGRPFNLMLRDLQAQGARLIWGKAFRDFTIEHVVDMCENGLAFDASLLLGAVTEIVDYIGMEGTHQLTARLQLLQKMLKYGLSTPTDIVLYELGFSDRTLVTEMRLSLNLFDEQRRDVIRSLRQHTETVAAILDRYPSYFTYISSHVV